MTDSLLAITLNEPCATVAQPSLADLTTACTEMDAEVLGEFVERNWDPAMGNIHGLLFLVREMKRKFKLLDRKKQVNGEYKTIRGFRSFKKWFASFTGKSERVGYYLLETEEKKHKRNAARRSEKEKKPADTLVAGIGDAKKALAEIQRQISGEFCTQDKRQEREALEAKVNSTITSVLREFLALIAPDGYKVSQGDNGKWSLSKEADIVIIPEEQKARRSAAAKKAAATRAAKEAIDPYDVTEIAPSEKETAELLETFGGQPTDAPAPTPDETEDSHIEIKGGISAGALWCGETKSRVKVSPKKATCEECIRRHADWESNKAAKSVAKPKVHFLTEEMVIDGKVYGETLACHPSVKPKPKQLTTSDWSKVTCARCKSSNTE